MEIIISALNYSVVSLQRQETTDPARLLHRGMVCGKKTSAWMRLLCIVSHVTPLFVSSKVHGQVFCFINGCSLSVDFVEECLGELLSSSFHYWRLQLIKYSIEWFVFPQRLHNGRPSCAFSGSPTMKLKLHVLYARELLFFGSISTACWETVCSPIC